MSDRRLFVDRDAPREVMARIRDAGPVAWQDLDPEQADLGVRKLRLAGVYDDRQEGLFMLRTRLPGGILTAEQAEVVADVARTFSNRLAKPEGEPDAIWEALPERFVEITTRQDLQLHWIRFESLPEVWRRYDDVGLTTLQACGDTLRNVTTCPVAGLSSSEWLDGRPVVEALNRFGLDEPGLTALLPRKFKVSVTGCRSDCVVSGIQDLAFTPSRRDGVVGFNVHAGGGLSDYPRLATRLDVFVPPDAVVDVTRAVLRLYADLGDPEAKAVNRFRMLVHQLGAERIERELRKRLEADLAACGEDLCEWRAEDHLGVWEQRDGTRFVGLCVPLGRLPADELAELARLARVHGDGGLRLTQRQNVVLPGVRDVDALLREPLLERLRPEADAVTAGVIACTGAPFCKFGVVDTKALAARMLGELRAALPAEALDALRGLRLHVSGCKASCAQTHAAHLGLRGTAAQSADGHEPAFDIAVGGEPGSGRLARWVAEAVPVPVVMRALGRMLGDAAADGGPAGIDGQIVRNAVHEAGGAIR